MDNKEENLKRAFEYLRKFYSEIAQLLSDVINSMSEEGWEPFGDGGVIADFSYSLNNPDKWAAHLVYKTFTNSMIEDYSKGIYIVCDEAVGGLPPSIILGKINVPPTEHEKWDLYYFIRKNKEKIRGLTGEIVEASYTKSGTEITGQLCALPLSEVTSKQDLDEKIISRFVDL